MSVIDTILVITGSLDLTLGFFVLLRNRNNPIHLSFTFFSFSLALWALGIAFFRMSPDPVWSLIWAKIYYISASFIAASLLFFANIFPKAEKLSTKVKLLIIIPSVLHACLLLIPNYLIKGIIEHSWGKEVVLGKLEYSLYTLYFLPFFYGALYILWKKYQQYSGIIKRQILFVLISILVASIFGVTFNLFLPWFGNYRLIHLGPPFTMIIFWILTYAIIRHSLWDFRWTFTRVVANAFLIALVGILYSFFLLSLSNTYLAKIPQNIQLVLGSLFTFSIALSFQSLKKYLEKITDRIFYRDHYETDSFLSYLGHTISSSIDITTLSQNFLNALIKNMRITRGALVIFEKDNIYNTYYLGYSNKLQFTYSNLAPVLSQNEVFIFDELEEGNIKQLFREMGVSISKVLTLNDQIVGLLLLGDKSSGEIYSSQDINIINIIAPEVAIAIQNAQSFDKIKKFNITLTKEVQKATTNLKNANARLEELDSLKDDFVSVASHELRTPMTAIRSYAWMALNRPDIPVSEKMKRYLSRVLSSTERLISLVNDMLNVSRIESGRVEITPQEFDITALFSEVFTEIEPKVKERNLHLQMTQDHLPKVFADQDKVHQVLLNLLGNALKFTPNGGLILISFLNDGQFLEIDIKDSGVGISSDDITRLFQKFSRLDNSYVAAATSGGTGLGLYICKSLVTLMGGKIWANSEGLNKGTTFTFTLPIATPATIQQAPKFTSHVDGEAKILEPVTI